MWCISLSSGASSSTSKMVSVPPMTFCSPERHDGRDALFVPGRQIDLEGGSFLQPAGDLNPALMLFDNAINGRQTQARAAPQLPWW